MDSNPRITCIIHPHKMSNEILFVQSVIVFIQQGIKTLLDL